MKVDKYVKIAPDCSHQTCCSYSVFKVCSKKDVHLEDVLYYKKLNKHTFNDRCVMDENFSYFSCVTPSLSIGALH